ncbi:MAG: protein translocase SEC61 complex subunit gamma [Candidatus Woesearchaeota archaeon]|jgi:protein transport protein SEC61 subunit gamma-like protein
MEEELEIQQPNKVKRFFKECMRVIHITKKPSKEEYKNTLKITALGTAIIGALGFLIFILKQLLIG